MKIAIIGGGFTGLTAAYQLAKCGHVVTLFEKEKVLGGLAYGFQRSNWDWHLEYAYHHWFTNDKAILTLARELGLQNKLLTLHPITATLWKNHMYPLDSAKSLLTFPAIPPIDRLRTGILLAILKLNPFWQPLERITAKDLFRTVGGESAWHTIWEPLMIGKFGPYADTVQAAWLWARVKKRTPSLGYIRGGFHTLIEALEKFIKKHGGTIHTGVSISSVEEIQKTFDTILLTVPTPIAQKLAPMIPSSYFAGLRTIPHLHAQTLIVETDKPIIKDTYWLNVTDRTYPFLAAVAHTNFVDKKHYGGRHLTYFGNYLPGAHPYLSMTKEQLLKKFMPFIKRLSPNSGFKIHNAWLFTGPFAQPVHERNYSEKIPAIKTPVPGIYLANMDFIVPWDRGTNYAVELGMKAAKIIHEKI